MAAQDTAPQVEVTSLADWRQWLQAHHDRGASIWLVTWKAHHPARHVPMPELVDEALRWGWVDSLPRALDADRSMRRFSPRRPGSSWSRVNKARVAALMASGRMQPAGLAAVQRAQQDGSWAALDAVEDLSVPDDLRAALQAQPPAERHFQAFPRSSQRNILEWIAAAKRPDTRAARIATTAEMAARNLRANHARQPASAGRPTAQG